MGFTRRPYRPNPSGDGGSRHRQTGQVCTARPPGNAQNRVGRVYWYAWDLQRSANTKMVLTDGITTTPAGRAFAAARSWMLGFSPGGCSRNCAGTYTCVLRSGGEVRRVVWNPTKRVAVRAPAGTTAYVTGNNVTHAARGGTRLYAGQVPFLFRGSR